MFITCPSCQTRYAVDDAKFGTGQRKVRCVRCGTKWVEQGRGDNLSLDAHTHASSVTDERQNADDPTGTSVPPPIDRPERSYTEPKAEGGSGGLIFLLFTAFIILALVGVYNFKDRIIAVFPQASEPINLYTNFVDDSWNWVLGNSFIDPIAASGLKLSESAYDLFEREEGRALGIYTVVSNNGKEEVDVPPVTIILRDNLGEELFRWTVDAPVATLQPEGTAEIRDEIMLPPDGIAQVEFDFTRD